MVVGDSDRICFREEGNFQAGAVFVVDKPLKWTSFDVVNKIRGALKKNYGKMKVGHAGTLDPLATGVVVVCVGKETKEIHGRRKGIYCRVDFWAYNTFL